MNPTPKNFFESMKSLPGQKSIDRYVMSHEWAYKTGYAIAVVSSFWIGGYGGALYQSYYTYIATGSTTQAVIVGAIAAARQYAGNYATTGSGWSMPTNGGGILRPSPNSGSGATGLDLPSMLLDEFAAAPAPPTKEMERRTLNTKEVNALRSVISDLRTRVDGITTADEWNAFNSGYAGSLEAENLTWYEAKFMLQNQLHVLTVQLSATVVASRAEDVLGAGAKAGVFRTVPQPVRAPLSWVLRTSDGVYFEFHYELFPNRIELWAVDRDTGRRYDFDTR